MRTDDDRLRDILERAERIARHTQLGGPEDLVLDAVLHNLVVIGEAVRGLSADCRERETGQIEQPGLRAGVDQQVQVAAVISITAGDLPENADVADSVPAAYPSPPRIVRGSAVERE